MGFIRGLGRTNQAQAKQATQVEKPADKIKGNRPAKPMLGGFKAMQGLFRKKTTPLPDKLNPAPAKLSKPVQNTASSAQSNAAHLQDIRGRQQLSKKISAKADKPATTPREKTAAPAQATNKSPELRKKIVTLLARNSVDMAEKTSRDSSKRVDDITGSIRRGMRRTGSTEKQAYLQTTQDAIRENPGLRQEAPALLKKLNFMKVSTAINEGKEHAKQTGKPADGAVASHLKEMLSVTPSSEHQELLNIARVGLKDVPLKHDKEVILSFLAKEFSPAAEKGEAQPSTPLPSPPTPSSSAPLQPEPTIALAENSQVSKPPEDNSDLRTKAQPESEPKKTDNGKPPASGSTPVENDIATPAPTGRSINDGIDGTNDHLELDIEGAITTINDEVALTEGEVAAETRRMQTPESVSAEDVLENVDEEIDLGLSPTEASQLKDKMLNIEPIKVDTPSYLQPKEEKVDTSGIPRSYHVDPEVLASISDKDIDNMFEEDPGVLQSILDSLPKRPKEEGVLNNGIAQLRPKEEGFPLTQETSTIESPAAQAQAKNDPSLQVDGVPVSPMTSAGSLDSSGSAAESSPAHTDNRSAMESNGSVNAPLSEFDLNAVSDDAISILSEDSFSSEEPSDEDFLASEIDSLETENDNKELAEALRMRDESAAELNRAQDEAMAVINKVNETQRAYNQQISELFPEIDLDAELEELEMLEKSSGDEKGGEDLMASFRRNMHEAQHKM